MVLRSIGPCLIAALMRCERSDGPDSEWLLHGPSDPEVVAANEDEPTEAARMAAE